MNKTTCAAGNFSASFLNLLFYALHDECGMWPFQNDRWDRESNSGTAAWVEELDEDAVWLLEVAGSVAKILILVAKSSRCLSLTSQPITLSSTVLAFDIVESVPDTALAICGVPQWLHNECLHTIDNIVVRSSGSSNRLHEEHWLARRMVI